MKVKIESGSPDGVLIRVEEPYCVDTLEEAYKIVNVLFDLEYRLRQMTKEEIQKFLQGEFPIKIKK